MAHGSLNCNSCRLPSRSHFAQPVCSLGARNNPHSNPEMDAARVTSCRRRCGRPIGDLLRRLRQR